jgi:hypothetical protein
MDLSVHKAESKVKTSLGVRGWVGALLSMCDKEANFLYLSASKHIETLQQRVIKDL